MQRVGAVCPAVRWRSQSLLLGRRARLDRRPTRHGHGHFSSQATAGASEELQRPGLTEHPDAPAASGRPVEDQPVVEAGVWHSLFLRGSPAEPQAAADMVKPWPGSLVPTRLSRAAAALDISRAGRRGVRMHPVLRPAIASAAARRHRRCEASARELTPRVGDRRRGFAMPNPRTRDRAAAWMERPAPVTHVGPAYGASAPQGAVP